jgi:nucleotide-binding universal stress UspA family protein
MKQPHGKSVVVGIDGSKTAICAALWAVDEAVSRQVPLHLLYAVEQGDNHDADSVARNLSAAETALRQAFTAVEATGRPVQIETEIVDGSAVTSLIGASASAAMVCVGAVGLRHFRPGRVGSTAAALAISGRCPVAIIRSRDDHHGQPEQIVVDVDVSPHNGVVLGTAMEEACLRNKAIRAVACQQARADLDRRLARWRRQYPHLDVEAVAMQGCLLEYLARNRGSVALVIIGAHNRQHLAELLGPRGNAALGDADCSLLVVNRAHS